MSEYRVQTLGEARFDSPLTSWVDDDMMVPAHVVKSTKHRLDDVPYFELAGPRKTVFFGKQTARAGIVTCGGLCPGLNNVVRSVVLELFYHYGVTEVVGFRYGYGGLDPANGAEPMVLTPDVVDDIHKEGGTILGTSRGPVDPNVALAEVMRRKLNILFTIGGDGTQRGALGLYHAAREKGYPLAVVGIPKTIDNDVAFVARSFGFLTSVEVAASVLGCAHIEARSVQNGISIVKLMGRDAGFITSGATVANQDVNFALVPEIPFKLEGEQGFLPVLKRRVLARSHAVIAVAEGAGQDLIPGGRGEKDASGNVKLKDIGLFLKGRVEEYFKAEKIPVTLRYFDPSYLIRSYPADAEDAMLCDVFARSAVHAAMAGKTGLVIGCLHDHFIHVPIEMLASQKKRLDPHSAAWRAVLAATGQPERFE